MSPGCHLAADMSVFSIRLKNFKCFFMPKIALCLCVVCVKLNFGQGLGFVKLLNMTLQNSHFLKYKCEQNTQ